MTETLVCAAHPGAQDGNASQQAQQLQPNHHMLAACLRAYVLQHISHPVVPSWLAHLPICFCTCKYLSNPSCHLVAGLMQQHKLAMQAEHRTTSLMCAATQVRARLYSRKAQTSAALTQFYSSSGTMLPMLTGATLMSPR